MSLEYWLSKLRAAKTKFGINTVVLFIFWRLIKVKYITQNKNTTNLEIVQGRDEGQLGGLVMKMEKKDIDIQYNLEVKLLGLAQI